MIRCTKLEFVFVMLVFGFLGCLLLPNVWFLAKKESVDVGVGLEDPG